jgi:antitoxin FitA
MADILVRNLSDEAVEELKMQAEENGRSLQGEVRVVLEDVAHLRTRMREFRRISEASIGELAGRPQSDSAELIAEDRLR